MAAAKTSTCVIDPPNTSPVMNTKTRLIFALACGTLAPLLPGKAADAEAPLGKITGEVTPKLYLFKYFDGVGTDKINYLERYRVQKGWGGDRRSGLYLDLDLDLIYRATEDQSFTVKRWGEGQYRHGGQAKWDTERLQFSADYSFFRRATGGIDYLFSPDQVPGGTDPSYFYPAATNTASGYAANFVDDSNRFILEMSRFAYGLGFVIKPGVLGEKTTIAVNYSGYLRYGRRLQTTVMGGSDFQSPISGDRTFALQRWRGFSRSVDENMNRLGWSVTASPMDVVNLAYTGALEKFDNRARVYTHRDIPLVAPYNYNPTADQSRPFGYIPDSSLASHNLRVSKMMGSGSVSAGYGMSKLEQDTFSEPQTRLGYTKGEVNVENAFVNFDANLTPTAGLQGFVKYGQRDNDSSYPVLGLINGNLGAGETLTVRTNSIESTRYGLAAILRPPGLGSTVTLGWMGEDKSRDLTYHATGVIPSVSLYRSDTESDEVYAKLSSLNYKGVNLRLTTSYAWADKTGLVTEPSQAFGLKAAMSYAAPAGVVMSGYYSIKDKENDNNTWTDKAVAVPATYNQDLASTVQSAGASFNYSPGKDAQVYVGLDWMRMDASVLFYESSRRRFESTTTFALRDTVGSLVDNYLFTVGGEYQAGDRLKLSGLYSLSISDGNLASGYVANQLSAIDDTLDNVLHTVILGSDYELTKTRKLRLSYRFDNYEDSAYPLLSGGVHSIMVGMTFTL